jgi:hypothetical protein
MSAKKTRKKNNEQLNFDYDGDIESDDEDVEEEERPRADKGLGDLLRKVVSVGVGSAFLGEETVKGLLKDVPLPKDLLNGLLQNAKHAKAEFIETVQEELKEQFTKIDPSKIVEEIAEKYDIEVKATFKFKKKDQGEGES